MLDEWNEQDHALLELLGVLRETGYCFVTPTPKTHRIVLARQLDLTAQTLADVLGWSRPFLPGSIDSRVESLLLQGRAILTLQGRLRSTLRVSSLDGHLFLHSAYPTDAPQSVFFGPDSYRFARLLREELHGTRAASIVDIGTGSGVGAIIASEQIPSAPVRMTDINPCALRLARINAAFAGITPSLHLGDLLADVPDPIDLAIANPPYIVDTEHRAYRDGGSLHGAELSIRMTRNVLERLAPGGRFLLYTGSAIVNGTDRFAEIASKIAGSCFNLDYYEIDPDVFGEELVEPGYADVDRIAAIAAVFTSCRGLSGASK